MKKNHSEPSSNNNHQYQVNFVSHDVQQHHNMNNNHTEGNDSMIMMRSTQNDEFTNNNNHYHNHTEQNHSNGSYNNNHNNHERHYSNRRGGQNHRGRYSNNHNKRRNYNEKGGMNHNDNKNNINNHGDEYNPVYENGHAANHNDDCAVQQPLQNDYVNGHRNQIPNHQNGIMNEQQQRPQLPTLQHQQPTILGIPVNTIPKPDGNNNNNNNNHETSSMRLQQAVPFESNKALHRIESSASILSERSEKDAKAGMAGGTIDLLRHGKQQSRSTTTKKEKDTKNKKDPSMKKKRSKKSKKGSSSNNNNNNHQHNDEIANQRAAKAFNSAVRKCVERSDPDGLYDLLHSKSNHKFALHADVLEIVLKAFVVAAMFDEALYCCRNCTRPGTLSTLQAERILQCLPQNLRNSSAFVAADMINALCIATDFDKPTHRTYFMRIVRGIALEFLEEATSARDRICSAPCERLVRSAVCIVDAQLRRGKKAADLVVLPGKQLGVFVPDSMENRGIQAGDAVGILPYAGPYPMSAESLDRNMIEATVAGLHPMILRLQDRTNTNLYATLTEPAEGNVYRIDKLANRMGFNRQLAAAVALASPLEKDANGVVVVGCDMRRPSPELIQAITAMDENIDRNMINGNVSRNHVHGEMTSTAALCAQPVPFTSMEDLNYNNYNEMKTADQNDEDAIRDAARLALDKYGAFEGLNASQRLAVEGAATNRLTLVQGPPGTG